MANSCNRQVTLQHVFNSSVDPFWIEIFAENILVNKVDTLKMGTKIIKYTNVAQSAIKIYEISILKFCFS